MRIIHIITTIELGGAEKQLAIIAKAQVEFGHVVEVVYLKGDSHLADTLQQSGIKVHFSVAKAPWIYKLKALKKILKSKPDVVHAHLPASEFIAALAILEIPLIISRHNTERLLSESFSFFSKLLARFIEYRATFCIAITDTVRNFMLNKGEWRNPKTIFTVLYAFDPNLIPSPIIQNRTEPTRFLTISRLVPQKDIPTLLRAYASFCNEDQHSELSIIGSGPEILKLQKLSQTLGIGKRISWLGKTAQTAQAIGQSDLFVLTSKYEGFGLVLLEAMALGRPILAAANPAVKEVLGDKYPGLFNIGDHRELCLLMLRARNFAFRKELVTYLHNRLNLFELSKSIQETNLVYVNSITRTRDSKTENK